MNQTLTISSETVADQLNEWQIRNYDPRDLSLLGVTLTNPAIYALGGSGVLELAEDSSRLTMFASEAVLGREWNTPEEDEAWAHL